AGWSRSRSPRPQARRRPGRGAPGRARDWPTGAVASRTNHHGEGRAMRTESPRHTRPAFRWPRRSRSTLAAVLLAAAPTLLVLACGDDDEGTGPAGRRPLDPQPVAQGTASFRFGPLGDEAY